MLEQSILKSTKKVLGIGVDDDSFDLDVMTFINSAFSNLAQIGIGPAEGVFIEDDIATWDDLEIEDIPILSQLKTCVYLRTRMLFDPPQLSYLQESMGRQIQEHEWRLNAMWEATGWVDPDPPEVMVDG